MQGRPAFFAPCHRVCPSINQGFDNIQVLTVCNRIMQGRPVTFLPCIGINTCVKACGHALKVAVLKYSSVPHPLQFSAACACVKNPNKNRTKILLIILCMIDLPVIMSPTKQASSFAIRTLTICTSTFQNRTVLLQARTQFIYGFAALRSLQRTVVIESGHAVKSIVVIIRKITLVFFPAHILEILKCLLHRTLCLPTLSLRRCPSRIDIPIGLLT